MTSKQALVLVLAAVSILGGCSSSPVRIATDATFPPFHMIDDDGEVTGFDVHLARAVVRRAGLDPQVIVAPEYGDLFRGLEEGRYDMVAATTGITAERRERFLFSEPYFTTCQAIIVRAGDGEPRVPADLAARPVGATIGTTSEAATLGLGAELVAVESARAGLAALAEGSIDAIIADEFEAVALARDAAAVRVLPEPAAMEHYGFVLPPRSRSLKRRLDDAMVQLRVRGDIEVLRWRFGIERPSDWPVRPLRTAPRSGPR